MKLTDSYYRFRKGLRINGIHLLIQYIVCLYVNKQIDAHTIKRRLQDKCRISKTPPNISQPKFRESS